MNKQQIKQTAKSLLDDHLRLRDENNYLKKEIKRLEYENKAQKEAIQLQYSKQQKYNHLIDMFDFEAQEQFKFCFKRMLEHFNQNKDERFTQYFENGQEAYNKFFKTQIEITDYDTFRTLQKNRVR